MAAGVHTESAGVLRRFGAIFYDALLLIAVMMVVTAIVLPFTAGEPILKETVGPLEHAYRAFLVLIVVGFFGWCWTKRGQTLGMTAWRLKVVRADGALLTWGDVLKRLAAACVSWLPLGLGYFWIWVDRDGLAWHDRWTHTRVIVVPKHKR